MSDTGICLDVGFALNLKNYTELPYEHAAPIPMSYCIDTGVSGLEEESM